MNTHLELPNEAELTRNEELRADIIRAIGSATTTNTRLEVDEHNPDGLARVREKGKVDADYFPNYIKNQDSRTASTMPYFIIGLSKIGEFDGSALPDVTAIKHDGTQISGISAEDGVIYGLESPFHANSLSVETLDYISHKLSADSFHGRYHRYKKEDETPLDAERRRIINSWRDMTAHDESSFNDSGIFKTLDDYNMTAAKMKDDARHGRLGSDIEDQLTKLAESLLPQVEAELAAMGETLMNAAWPLVDNKGSSIHQKA